MCRRTTCRKCGKPSWAGCGAHVEMVLGDVPKSERCRCHEQPRGAASSPKAKSAAVKTGKPAAEPADQSAFGRFKVWLRQ